jgi:hypothetical protein
MARRASDRTHFGEAAGIEQKIDPFAHIQPPRLRLTRQLFRAAHAFGQRLTLAQLLDFVFPAHLNSIPPRNSEERCPVFPFN